MDITQLVLDDHHEQRRLFAILAQIDRYETEALSAVWGRLAAFLEAAALVVEPLLALADALLAPFQVTAEAAHLVLGQADLVLDHAPALHALLGRLLSRYLRGLPGGLLGRLGGAAEGLVRLGQRPDPDLLGVGLRLLGQLGRVGVRRDAGRDAAQHNHERAEREGQGDNADHQQRACAAHGRPFRYAPNRYSANHGVVRQRAACRDGRDDQWCGQP